MDTRIPRISSIFRTVALAVIFAASCRLPGIDQYEHRASAQDFGSFTDLPLLSSGGINLSNLPGEVLYVNADFGVTNRSAVSPAPNGDFVQGWLDLTGQQHALQNLAGAGAVIWVSSGGPNNTAYVAFTNYASGGYLTNLNVPYTPQPNTFFLEMFDPTCCNADNGGAIMDSATASFPQQMVSFHPDIGITGINLVSPTSVPLFDGRAFDDSSAFGWPFGSWAIVTVQFNGTNSQVFVNGTGPKHTATYGPNYAPGTNGCQGFFLANSTGSGIVGHGSPLTSPSIMNVRKVIWVTGGTYTNGPTRHAVEQAMGLPDGIPVL